MKNGPSEYFDQQGILNVDRNYLPEGLIKLEALFNQNDKARGGSTSEEASERKV